MLMRRKQKPIKETKSDALALIYVKRYIASAPYNYIFTTRELLQLIKLRATLDSFLSRQAKAGYLERLTWGVYRRYDPRNKPVPEERLAAIKRKAFAGDMATTNQTRAEQVQEKSLFRRKAGVLPGRHTRFLCRGVKCGFKAEQIIFDAQQGIGYLREARVNFKAVGNRKIALGETEVGRAFRELWLLGEAYASRKVVEGIYQKLTREQRLFLPNLKRFLPQWISDKLPDLPTEAIMTILEIPKLKKRNEIKNYRKPGRRRVY